ncbi:MAG: class I SAM-dependent methyltransferase [Armatimonadetes bacterium]|nr:class I SAM-dependent methyltransferase [Armatimonadota bacterium]
MKHASGLEETALYLERYASRHDLPLAEAHTERIASLVTWIAPAAHRMGLTKYARPLAMCENLVAPALLVLSPDIMPLVRSPMLDFGTGSGAIGLSLGISLPEHEMVLADRRDRVVQFTDLAARRQGIGNARSMLTDLSAPAPGHGPSFATVLVRAFGPAAQALSDAAGWVGPGGVVALWHQPGPPDAPDGLKALRTDPTELPSLVLTLYQRA